MARVDFYILAQSDERARHVLACKLAEKAWRLDNTVYIHTRDRSDAESIDELLWTFRDGSFVPHGLASNQDGTEASPSCFRTRGNRCDEGFRSVWMDNTVRRDNIKVTNSVTS